MEKIFVPGAPGTATPQEKLFHTIRSLGINQSDVTQVTTRTIYDTLSLVNGGNTFNFFQGVNNRAFPLTNLSQNRLEVGEAMIIQRISFSALLFDAGTGTYLMTGPLSNIANSFMQSLLNIRVANSVILKDFHVAHMFDLFNEFSEQDNQEPYEFKTLLTIPSLQEFVATLRINDPAPIALQYLRLTLQGVGIIYRTQSAL